jgi:hypothetical protein
VLLIVYAPVLNETLGTVPLGARALLLAALLATLPFLVVEAGKVVLRLTGWRLEGSFR